MVQSRIRALDAGRGAAMLFVFLSHFLEYYLTCHGKLEQLHFLWRFTLIASPTFVLISGTTLGYLFSVKKTNFGPTQRKFIDRGLFLISIAHLLIMFSWRPMIEFFHGSIWRVLFITDTIGFCLIAGPFLISKVKPSGRLTLAVILYSLSWLIISFGNLKNVDLEIISETFFGELKNSFLFDVFPIIPWFSLYLVGTTIGERVGFYQLNGFQKDITALFFKIGLSSIGFSFMIIVFHKLLKAKGIPELDETILALISSTQKDPPGLVYFLFYGGVGMIMLAVLNKLVESQLFGVVLHNLEIIGKTSLFAFVLQYFMYFSVVVWINPPYWKIWPLFFILTMFINIILIRLWDKKELNKYITVLNLSVWKNIFKKTY